jgi:hypothetical protein
VKSIQRVLQKNVSPMKLGKEGLYQSILKRVDLPIVPRDECQELLRTTRLGNRFDLSDSFVCAGGAKGKDTCKVRNLCDYGLL